MTQIISERAKKMLESPQYLTEVNPSLMRRFPSDEIQLWAQITLEGMLVKNLSFAGELKDHQKVILEALSHMIKGKAYLLIEKLSLRECEAFLRDRNSVEAISGLSESDQLWLTKVTQWIAKFPTPKEVKDYQYRVENGPFSQLSLVDKIKELKDFFNSSDVSRLYTNRIRPSLVDVDDLTVYVQVPYSSEEDRAVFEDLHLLGVATFQEESLNFIPEI